MATNEWSPWAGVTGNLTQLSVGSNSVWGVNDAGKIYVRPRDTMSSWQPVDGSATEVEVGPQGAVFAATAQGDLYMRLGADGMNIAGTSWAPIDTMVPGAITNLSVGTNFVYVIGSMGNIYRHAIRSRNVGTDALMDQGNWHQLPGSAVRVAVNAVDKAFVVNNNGIIYHLAPNDSWVKMNGTLLDIAASRTEVIGCKENGEVYSWTLDQTGTPDSMGSWVKRSGKLARIHASEDGAIWGVNSAQKIYAAESTSSPPPYSIEPSPASPMPVEEGPRPTHWNDWAVCSGALIQCSVGTKQVWGVNQAGNIYVRPLDTMSQWKKVDGGAIEVEVGPQGAVYAANVSGDVFMRLGANNRHISGDRWSKIDSRTPGRVTNLAVGADYLYVVGSSSRIYRHAINRSGDVGNRVRWHHVPGAARRIAIGPTGKVFCVNDQDRIFHLSRDDRWQPVAGACTDIAVTEHELVGCNQQGSIFSWVLDRHACPHHKAEWHQRSGNVSRISANGNGHIWGINSAQNIWATESSAHRRHSSHEHKAPVTHVVHHTSSSSSGGGSGLGMAGAAIGGAVLGAGLAAAMRPSPRPIHVVHKPAPRPIHVVHKPAPRPIHVVHTPAPRPVVIHKPAPRPVVIHKPAPRPVIVKPSPRPGMGMGGGGMGMGGGRMGGGGMGGGRHGGGGMGGGGMGMGGGRHGGGGGRHGGGRRR